MNLTPNSWGSELLEFNPCHSTTDGTFAAKGQGRCLGDAARRGARIAHSKQEQAAWRDAYDMSAQMELESIQKHFGVSPVFDRRWLRTRREQALHHRREELRMQGASRRKQRQLPLPAFLQQDAQRGWKTDRVTVAYSGVEEPHTSPGYAEGERRHISVAPSTPNRRFHTKTEQLSTLRHELGHIDRTPLGKGHDNIQGHYFSPRYMEEIRAWKNAIRNSKGRVDWNTVRAGLESYLADSEHLVTKTSHGIGVPSLVEHFGDRHIALLKRYAQKIRRASKGL